MASKKVAFVSSGAIYLYFANNELNQFFKGNKAYFSDRVWLNSAPFHFKIFLIVFEHFFFF